MKFHNIVTAPGGRIGWPVVYDWLRLIVLTQTRHPTGLPAVVGFMGQVIYLAHSLSRSSNDYFHFRHHLLC